jgi:hypothetical protein
LHEAELGHPIEEHGGTEWYESHRKLPSTLEDDSWECTEWMEWRSALSPKEHYEFRERLWAQEREERLLREMHKREDDRDAAMLARENSRDERLTKLQEKLHTREMWILGGVVTVAVVGGAIVAAVVEGAVSRGWEPAWWPL